MRVFDSVSHLLLNLCYSLRPKVLEEGTLAFCDLYHLFDLIAQKTGHEVNTPQPRSFLGGVICFFLWFFCHHDIWALLFGFGLFCFAVRHHEALSDFFLFLVMILRGQDHTVCNTRWQRCIGYLKLQVSFRKRASDCMALLREMTYIIEKVSYVSSPPCIHKFDSCCQTTEGLDGSVFFCCWIFEHEVWMRLPRFLWCS